MRISYYFTARHSIQEIKVGAQMRLLYTTALYHDYVAKDIPLSELITVEKQVPQDERELLQA